MAIGIGIISGGGQLLIVVIVLGYILILYNSLIRLKNDIDKAWSNIDVLLKQRNDELPNLIAAVKGYMTHESSLFQQISLARASMLNAKTLGEKVMASNALSGMLKTLFAVSENYPQLRANENFLKLQQRITGLENEIADRREFYNDAVTTYNIKIESFPEMMIAKLASLTRREQLKAAESEQQPVNVGAQMSAPPS